MHEFWKNIDWSRWGPLLLHYGLNIIGALLILLIGFWLVARVANLGRRAMLRGGFDDTLVTFLRKVIYGALITLVLVVALQQVGIPSAPFVAAIAAAGLAIGLALQGSLSNLAWGVLLITFRPFRAGDFVQVGGQMGTVDHIDLMQTYLNMADGCEAIVPNAKVGGDAIINFNRRGQRRFEFNVGIGSGDDIGHAMQVVHDVFASDKRILTDPAPNVWMNKLDDGRVNLLIRGWATVDDFWEAQRAFIRELKERFDAEGITVPFQQHEIKLVGAALASPDETDAK